MKTFRIQNKSNSIVVEYSAQACRMMTNFEYLRMPDFSNRFENEFEVTRVQTDYIGRSSIVDFRKREGDLRSLIEILQLIVDDTMI